MFHITCCMLQYYFFKIILYRMLDITIIIVIIIILCVLFVIIFHYEDKAARQIHFNTPNWNRQIDDNDLVREINNIHVPVTNPPDQVFYLNLFERQIRNADHENIAVNPNIMDRVFNEIINGVVVLMVDQIQDNHQLFPEDVFALDILEQMNIDTTQMRQNANDNKMKEIKAENPNAAKAEIIEKFIDKSVVHTNNPQNVHDSAVNKNACDIMERLKQEQDDVIPISICTDEFTKKFKKLKDFDQVLKVIHILSKSNTVSALNNMSDEEVFCRIWTRTKDIRNAENCDDIQEMIYKNLASCYEHNAIICVTGRVLRIISSLILLDFDEKNWVLELSESYKEEILNKTKNIINSIAHEGIKNEKIKDIAEEYIINEFDNEELSEEIINMVEKCQNENDLKKTMKYAINEMIDTYGEKNEKYNFPPKVLETIRMENLAALD